MTTKRLNIVLWLLGFAIVLALLAAFILSSNETVRKETAIKYANDPVMLYRTVGIKECGTNFRYRDEAARAVLVNDADLPRAIAFLEEKFNTTGIVAVLYTNISEAKQSDPVPELIPLKNDGGSYCTLGSISSQSVQIFLDFEATYQHQIK